MKILLSSKYVYFAGFGAIGGLLSGIIYGVSDLDNSSDWASWIIGTGFDGLFIAALLAVGQARYVGKSFDSKSFWKALLVGAIGGMIGGFIALMIGFPIAESLGGGTDAGRFLGWTLGGAAVGFAVSWVVPNLKRVTASLAGAAGGFFGCALMYLVSALVAATATTGAVIGLVIAFAEAAFRHAWLEVTIRPFGLSLEKERTITVSLGDKPVLFGCGADADVKLAEMPNAQPQYAKVFLSGRAVTLLDLATEKKRELAVDEGFDLANARLVVRAKSVWMKPA